MKNLFVNPNTHFGIDSLKKRIFGFWPLCGLFFFSVMVTLSTYCFLFQFSVPLSLFFVCVLTFIFIFIYRTLIVRHHIKQAFLVDKLHDVNIIIQVIPLMKSNRERRKLLRNFKKILEEEKLFLIGKPEELNNNRSVWDRFSRYVYQCECYYMLRELNIDENIKYSLNAKDIVSGVEREIQVIIENVIDNLFNKNKDTLSPNQANERIRMIFHDYVKTSMYLKKSLSHDKVYSLIKEKCYRLFLEPALNKALINQNDLEKPSVRARNLYHCVLLCKKLGFLEKEKECISAITDIIMNLDLSEKHDFLSEIFAHKKGIDSFMLN